jgi:hypothetical protein
MLNIITDAAIDAFLREKKPLPNGLRPHTKMIERNHSWRQEYPVTGELGTEFVIALRLSTLNVMDFSVILGYQVPGVNTIFRLRRYNGRSHWHTNTIENTHFRDFHIHTATERYQRRGAKEEHFAQIDKRYSTIDGAIDCLIEDCNFDAPMMNRNLFEGIS